MGGPYLFLCPYACYHQQWNRSNFRRGGDVSLVMLTQQFESLEISLPAIADYILQLNAACKNVHIIRQSRTAIYQNHLAE